ncbi:hypothetical protein ABZ467_07635 [Streptomyces sp. NPDC005727]|uniref:hypothetical protein n=1 Tax=Streptomyces sp. NPDC005727 TaxID=3157053 RepID=UPI0033DBDDA9
MADARKRAPEVRRRAAAPVIEDARREAEAVRAAGERAAQAVRERARARMPELVDRTVADAPRPATGAGGTPMSTAWAAATIRARALAQRRAGTTGAPENSRPPPASTTPCGNRP